jgi:HEAT repeat protein
LGEAGIPALIELTKVENAEARALGFSALGALGPKGLPAVPLLLPLLESKDPVVYDLALSALLRLGPEGPLPPSAEPGLKRLIVGNQQDLIGLAVTYLHRYGKRMLPFFAELCDHDNARFALRGACALSLYGTDAKEYLPKLLECQKRLSSQKYYARDYAPQLQKAIETIQDASKTRDKM